VTTDLLLGKSDPLDIPLANSAPTVSPSGATLALPIQHDLPASPDSDDGSVDISFEKNLTEMCLTDIQCAFILHVLLNGMMSDIQSPGDGLKSSDISLKWELEGAEDGKNARG
jgi:hypothetical protein